MTVGIFVVLAAAMAFAAWLASSLSGVPLVGYDDANIFFVYARNLVDGHGFVYNAGGERVEGFSSLSWLLVCAAARALTSRPEALLFAISILVISFALWRLCTLLTDLLARFDVADRPHTRVWSVALIAVVALAPGYVIWTVVSLMDTGLWSALLLLAAVATVRLAMGDPLAWGGRMLPLLLIAMALTRPESLLWGPVFLGLWLLIGVATGRGWPESARQHAGSAIALAVTVAGLFAWRLSYFGFPFPNTYYAKAGDPLAARLETGWSYLFDFALFHPAMLLAVPVALGTAAAAWARYRQTREDAVYRLLLAQACVLVMLLVGLAIPMIEGGDHFGFWRMYQPIVPLVALQAVLSSAMLAVARPAEPRYAAAAVLVAVALALPPWRHWAWLGETGYPAMSVPGSVWTSPRVEIAIAEDMRQIGAAFNRAFPDVKPSVGVIVAGGFALEYHGATFDLMGLNHVAMAHSPGPRLGMRNHAAFNHDVFFAVAPDVLMLSLWSPERPDWFDSPMMCGEFAAPPHTQPTYFERRRISMDQLDTGFLKRLLTTPRTGELYRWASVRPPGGSSWIHAVFKREFLSQLGERSYEVALPGPPR